MERYSEYKDSGVKWLGEIPSHWEILPIKHSYNFTVGWTPPTGRSDLFEGNNLWANISDLGKKEIYNTANHISDSAVRLSGRSISPKGSLLYSFKLSVGTVSFCGADMYTNEAIATFLKGTNSLEYLYYAAPLFIIKNANTNIYGAPILNQDLIKNALVLLPPRAEQDAIVRYLDAATSKIDKAIAMQQKMIDLLNERKQIIIQNAVTKGLDENVEMKDSGVEWIGMIPKHWGIEPIKLYIHKIGDGLHGTPIYDQGGGYYFINGNNLGSKQIVFTDKTNRVSTSEAKKYFVELDKNSLLISLNGTIGSTSFYSGEPVILSKSVGYIKFKETINKFFVRYLLATKIYENIFMTSLAGTTIANLSLETLRHLKMIIPPYNEQKIIGDYLDKEMQHFDSAITNCQRQITLLQERKQIIINEVVTGKVKVS